MCKKTSEYYDTEFFARNWEVPVIETAEGDLPPVMHEEEDAVDKQPLILVTI